MTMPTFHICIKEIFEETEKFLVEKYYVVKDREKNRNYSSSKINKLSISQEMKQNLSINEDNEKFNLSNRKKFKSPEKIYKKNIFNFTKDSRFINKRFNIIDFEKQNNIINNENQTKIKKLRDLTKFEKELKYLREAKTYESQKYSNLNNNERKPIFHINISNIKMNSTKLMNMKLKNISQLILRKKMKPIMQLNLKNLEKSKLQGFIDHVLSQI